MDARGKFGEHKKYVRVARGAAESNSTFLSALQTSKCIHNSIYAQLKAWANSFITERQWTKNAHVILFTHGRV